MKQYPAGNFLLMLSYLLRSSR